MDADSYHRLWGDHLHHEDMLAQHLCDEAAKHSGLNRYCNIFPFDSHLAKTSAGYVNASRVHLGPTSYIVASGPMHPAFHGPDTVPAFWKMAVEHDVKVVVSLTLFTHGFGGCADYLTTHPEMVKVHELTSPHEHIVLSDLQVRVPGLEPQNIKHVHFVAWPNYGVPSDPVMLSDVVRVVDQLSETANPTCPILVHCSGGIGRSGSFVTAHSKYREWKDHPTPFKVDHKSVDQRINELRKARHPWMVEGLEQYTLVHAALDDLFAGER